MRDGSATAVSPPRQDHSVAQPFRCARAPIRDLGLAFGVIDPRVRLRGVPLEALKQQHSRKQQYRG
jgi:hypothetical protein